MSLEEEEQNLKLKLVGKCFKTTTELPYYRGTVRRNQIIMIVGFGSKFIFDKELKGIYFLSKNEVCFHYLDTRWTVEAFFECLEDL